MLKISLPPGGNAFDIASLWSHWEWVSGLPLPAHASGVLRGAGARECEQSELMALCNEGTDNPGKCCWVKYEVTSRHRPQETFGNIYAFASGLRSRSLFLLWVFMRHMLTLAFKMKARWCNSMMDIPRITLHGEVLTTCSLSNVSQFVLKMSLPHQLRSPHRGLRSYRKSTSRLGMGPGWARKRCPI